MRKGVFRALLVVVLASALGGCSHPVEQAKVLDDRPLISFRTSLNADAMPVFVDGVRSGVVSDFAEGKRALRVLPGSHTISVRMPDGSVHEERVFVGHGVLKTIVLP